MLRGKISVRLILWGDAMQARTEQSIDRDAAFAEAKSLVVKDVFLRPCVLDMQMYDDTLTVFTDHEVPCTFVRGILAKSWPGEVEVFCATDLMTGSGTLS